MKLTMRKSDNLDDWYLIERAEHDGRSWIERDPISPNVMHFRCSSRLGNADIEGTGAEMLALAAAIEAGGSESFKRCAANRTDGGYQFFSPRNSDGDIPVVSFEDAKALAAEIRDTLA